MYFLTWRVNCKALVIEFSSSSWGRAGGVTSLQLISCQFSPCLVFGILSYSCALFSKLQKLQRCVSSRCVMGMWNKYLVAICKRWSHVLRHKLLVVNFCQSYQNWHFHGWYNKRSQIYIGTLTSNEFHQIMKPNATFICRSDWVLYWEDIQRVFCGSSWFLKNNLCIYLQIYIWLRLKLTVVTIQSFILIMGTK